MHSYNILNTSIISVCAIIKKNECDSKQDGLWVRFPFEEIKFVFKFIFTFLRYGVEAKRGIEFRHSARNAFRIRGKVGIGVSKLYFPLPTLLCAGYSVKLIIIIEIHQDETRQKTKTLLNLKHKKSKISSYLNTVYVNLLISRK